MLRAQTKEGLAFSKMFCDTRAVLHSHVRTDDDRRVGLHECWVFFLAELTYQDEAFALNTNKFLRLFYGSNNTRRGMIALKIIARELN